MEGATLVLVILSAGLASQWVAWRLKLPAIVVLIGSGLLLGPVTGVIDLGVPQAELADLIGLGVAIILFEGGMALRLGEFRRVGHGIGRLTVLAPGLSWLFGSLAAHYVAGLSWPVSLVLGAVLVVTGPTVILPLIRQARMNKDSASLLKWEGIVNDPIGVLMAVLTFQYFTVTGGGAMATMVSLASALAAGAVFGGAGGWLTGRLFGRGSVPEHLKPPILMVLVLVVYWASNLVQHEAGLLSVTVMGLVIGNMKLVERESLRHFKENLTVVLLSVLFIVIPSQITMDQIALLDWRAALFVLVTLVVVRPLAIAFATIGAPMRKEDRLLLAWIAPRGIVAAATAGIFGPALVTAGYADADRLLPIVFLIIIVTVVAHGLTIGSFTRRLDLAARNAHGVLVVGASRWTSAFAQVLTRLEVGVLVADGAYGRLRPLRMAGIAVYYGEILSEHAEHELETQHLGQLLCATDNDFYNALVCKSWGHEFGYHRAFQLATHQERDPEARRMTVQQRGRIAFDPSADYETLDARLRDGWTIRTTKLREGNDLGEVERRLGTRGSDWFLLGGTMPSGEFRLHSIERPIKPVAGWTLLYFAPEQMRA
ncbi:sodium:proton antiporter [soil metagenome]